MTNGRYIETGRNPPAGVRLKRIFLIRHAESEGNVDKTVHTRMPDHVIPLSMAGLTQADLAGEFLVKWLEENYRPAIRKMSTILHPSTVPKNYQLRLWNSPYKRTRQTADGIAAHLGNWLRDRAENILLCEQQFGLFDGVPDEELPTKFPLEHAHYKKCEDFEGRFWARMPMGESRFDVAQRVHQSFGTFIRDCERHSIDSIGITGHGVTNRAFMMMWLHLPFEWFEAEPNPGNASIRLIEWDEAQGCYVDRGYIFEGFKAPHNVTPAKTSPSETFDSLKAEVEKLRNGIRRHRDEKGHDRCWLDDAELYSLLPEGAQGADLTLPPKEEFMRGCDRFYELRRTRNKDDAENEARRLAKEGTLGKKITELTALTERVSLAIRAATERRREFTERVAKRLGISLD